MPVTISSLKVVGELVDQVAGGRRGQCRVGVHPLTYVNHAPGERLGMTADAVVALEPGGILPVTADLLVRLAGELDGPVELHVVAGGGTTVAFGERAA